MNKTLYAISRPVTLLLLSVFAVVASSAPADASELDDVKRDFIAIKKQLEDVKEEAMQSDSVRKAIDRVNAAMKSELLSIAPKKSEIIESYFDLLDQINAAKDAAKDAVVKDLEADIKKVASKLSSNLRKADKSASVQAAREMSADAVMAAMKTIEPKTQELMDRQSELYERYTELSD